MTVQEIADDLQVHIATVYRMVRAGRLLPPVRIGRESRWRTEDYVKCCREVPSLAPRVRGRRSK